MSIEVCFRALPLTLPLIDVSGVERSFFGPTGDTGGCFLAVTMSPSDSLFADMALDRHHLVGRWTGRTSCAGSSRVPGAGPVRLSHDRRRREPRRRHPWARRRLASRNHDAAGWCLRHRARFTAGMAGSRRLSVTLGRDLMTDMDVAIIGIIGLVVGIAGFVWWLLVLIEALRTPKTQWDAAGQNQLLYVLVMVFLGIIGTIAYVVVARPQLRATGPSPSV